MKKLAIMMMLLLCGTVVFAQWGSEEMPEKPSWRDRFFVGGGLGSIGFSSYADYFSINGLVGYKITPKLAGGVQVQYQYMKYKQFTPQLKANNYGVSPFLRFNFYGPLFLHAEYEYLSYQYPDVQLEMVRKGYESFMAGGGFFQPVGRNAGFYFAALYNFTYRDPSSSTDYIPYNSPLVIRAGITAGF